MKNASRAELCTEVANTLLASALNDARQRLGKRTITDEDIHESRKAIKRARAALRLLKNAIGEAAYRRDNAALRDAGRKLSAVRDAKATLGALDALEDRARRTPAAVGVELRRRLVDDLVCARRSLRRPSATLDEAAGLLDIHPQVANAPPRRARDASALVEGLTRIYRKGRNALDAAESAGTAEALHEWRKQVKYLLNAVTGIGPCLDPKAERVARRADKLADRLGDDHDLAVLAEQLSRISGRRDGLESAVAERRSTLQKRARKIGRKLYRRKPKRFVAGLVG